ISYMDVVWMATIPTVLYYLGLFLMVELDSRKLGIRKVELRRRPNAWRMVKERGFHFTSLVAVVVFMVIGFSAITAVFWATIAAAALSFLRKETALSFIPKAGTPLHRTRMVQALRAGSVGVLAVAATCAAAGIIVGVVTLTGLGLKFSSIVIDLAGGNVLATAACTALVVWVVGLAVPVTASYIICAVIACGVQGWMLQRTAWLERGVLIAGGILLLHPATAVQLVGFVLVAGVAASQSWRRRRA